MIVSASPNNGIRTSSKHTKSCFEVLSVLLNRFMSPQPAVIFVGAGISISSGLPSAKMFIEEAIQNCAVPIDKIILEKFLVKDRPDRLGPGDWLRFEGVVEAINKTFDPELKSLKVFKSNLIPNTNHQILARFIEAGHLIFTTNFDNLIEQACRNRGIEIKVAYLPEHFEQNIAAQSKGDQFPYQLCKLHGSIEDICSIQASLSRIGKNGITFNQAHQLEDL